MPHVVVDIDRTGRHQGLAGGQVELLAGDRANIIGGSNRLESFTTPTPNYANHFHSKIYRNIIIGSLTGSISIWSISSFPINFGNFQRPALLVQTKLY